MRRDRPPLQNQLAYLRLLGAGELADRVAMLQGLRDPHKTGWDMPDDWLHDGEVISHGERRLDVVATPGHTRVRVDELIAHHGTGLDETEAAILGGAQTAYDAAVRLRWTRREADGLRCYLPA